MSAVVLAVDGETASHLERAIAAYLHRAKRPPEHVGRALEAVRCAFSDASGGQGATETARENVSPQSGHMTPLLLRYERVAEVLDVSKRQVQRLVTSGVLPTVSILGAKRIPVQAVEQLANGSDHLPDEDHRGRATPTALAAGPPPPSPEPDGASHLSATP